MTGRRRCSALLVVAMVALGGCPGRANWRSDRGGDAYFGPLPDWPIGKKDKGAVKLDGVGPKVDRSAGSGDLPLSSEVGGPCPCSSPLLCVLDACRKPCNQVICNATTNCDPGQACINTKEQIPVCVPAVGTGQACSQTIFCAMGNRCLTKAPGSTQGTCYAACTSEGSACAGGTCNAPDPTNKACLYCY